MPLPISTALIFAGIALSHYHDHVIVYILVGLGVGNEILRAFFSGRQADPSGQYQIPAIGDPAARQRTPITYDDGRDGS